MHQPNDSETSGDATRRFRKLEFVVAHPTANPARDHPFETSGWKGPAGSDDDCAVWLHERLTACYND